MEQIKVFVLIGKNENLQDALNVSISAESQLQDHPRNELSPLPWCIDRVGNTETSKTTVPIAALNMALTESTMMASVIHLSNAKPPPNQVLGSVNEISQLRDEAFPSDEVFWNQMIMNHYLLIMWAIHN